MEGCYDAAQVHNPFDESRRFRYARQFIRHADDFLHCLYWNPVLFLHQPEDDELLFLFAFSDGIAGFRNRHLVILVRIAYGFAQFLGLEHAFRRKDRDETPAVLKPANRFDVVHGLSLAQQGRHGVDDIARHTQDFLDAIHHNANGNTVAKRNDHDLVGLGHLNRRQTEHVTKAYQRQEPVTQGDNPQNMPVAVRKLGDLVGELNDFFDTLDRECIFLIRHLETDEMVFVQDRLFRRLALRANLLCALSQPLRGALHDAAELSFHGLGGVEDHNHRLPIFALDHAGQETGINGGPDLGSRLDSVRVDRHNIGHPVNDESDGPAVIQDNDPRGIVVKRHWKMENLAQVQDRKDRSTEIGETFERGWAHGNLHQVRHANDFLHGREPDSKDFLADVENHKLA